MSWTKNDNVMWEEFDGGALLVDTTNGSRWTLSATAAAAWKLCDGKRTINEMATVLRQSKASIVDFCQQFETLGLLHGNPAMCLAQDTNSSFRSSAQTPFSFQSAGLGAVSRRRPSPRGNSSPG